MKRFNVTGVCSPEKHYMVDISERLKEIRAMVDAGEYFTINRSRQYGKTTTLAALQKYLADEYTVLSLDFQGISTDDFSDEYSFTRAFANLIKDAQEFSGLELPEETAVEINTIADSGSAVNLRGLMRTLMRWCRSGRDPLVLIIDEVDTASNYRVFMDFLAQLRDTYLDRASKGYPAFHSVILAGVTDIKHLKAKIRPDEAHKINSPWNIASDFNIDMSLSSDGIRGMLDEYEADHHTGMDTDAVAKEIRAYTEGYPFLVSRICFLIDTQLAGDGKIFAEPGRAWTAEGVSEAVRMILMESNTLFDSLMSKVYNNRELSDLLQRILFGGERISYNPDIIPAMDAEMYGFVTNKDGALAISNRIFETRLYNYFLSIDEMRSSPMAIAGSDGREELVHDGRLDMEKLLKNYASVFADVYGRDSEPFDEEEGRRRFLLYLRPVINGTGNYYIEPQTRNRERMDLVVDYLGERYVIELKIWRGQAYHIKGEKQLAGYIDSYHLDTGYMLTYNFNKSAESGVVHNEIDGKKLVEVFVSTN